MNNSKMKVAVLFLFAFFVAGCSENIAMVNTYENPESKKFLTSGNGEYSSGPAENKLGDDLVLLDIRNSANEVGKQTKTFWIKVISDQENEIFYVERVSLGGEKLSLEKSEFLTSIEYKNKTYLGGTKIVEILDEEIRSLFVNKEEIYVEIELRTGKARKFFKFEIIERQIPVVAWPT